MPAHIRSHMQTMPGEAHTHLIIHTYPHLIVHTYPWVYPLKATSIQWEAHTHLTVHNGML